MSDCDDAELVRRARLGDRLAFGHLLARHLPMLRRVCERVLGRADVLDDVAQEAALQALLGLENLRDPTQFGAWLTGIGLNVGRRRMRSCEREAWSWEALVGGRLVTEPLEKSQGPDELVEAAELSKAVRAAVADLPPGQRQAVLLVYLSGLSHREAAAALGIDPGAVKTRLYKGRNNLQRRLWNLWKEYEMSTPTSVQQHMVEMRVADVRRRAAQGDQPGRSHVLLEEVGGSRQLSIWIGQWESDAIAMSLEKVKVPRPLTHAFTASLLRAGGVHVPQVRIHRLAAETFYAQVVVRGTAGESAVDARPSDCIALALELGTPIFVADDVLVAVEAAPQSARPPADQPTIGSTEIVTDLIENWPHEPRPVR